MMRASHCILASLIIGCGGGGGGRDALTTDSVQDTAGGDADGDWTMPPGIPDPGFCIGWTAEESCAGCTVIVDPALEDLAGLAAGTIVEISGGPFTGGEFTISGEGTSDRPIFVRGAGPRPVISRPAQITGSYIIVENMDFDLAGGAEGLGIEGDHICLRHSEVHNMDPGHNSTVVYITSSTEVVIWDNDIHDNGDFDFVGEQDVHGIGASQTHRIWILGNRTFRNRGDSVQFGHAAGNTLGDFYLGGNDMHSDGENCVDIKEASNVVVSGNRLHGPAVDMPAVVFHDCPLNAAAIYNEIYDASAGVSMASLEAACDAHLPVSIFVIRNDFHDVSGQAVQGWGSGKLYHVTGNTFSSVGEAVSIDGAEAGSIVSETDDGLDDALDAFQAVYGIDISSP